MIIKNAVFIKSAASEDGFLDTCKPIIAICGKSNVGKSSLINMLGGNKKLAKTSDTPGRTRLINYFDFGEFILADLPGYGYARVSQEEKEKWGVLMGTFFEKTKLCHALSLIDIRHDPTADDETMINFLHGSIIPFTIVATKADKIGKNQIKPRLVSLGRYLTVTESLITPVSSESGYGKDVLLQKIENILKIYKGEDDGN